MHNRFNGHSSQSNPTFQEAMTAMWKKVDSELPAVDDIETISLHLPEDTQNNKDWIHGRNVPVIETPDYSIINSKARERRRMKIEAESKYQTRYPLTNVDHGDAEECIYSGFYENNCLVPDENLTINNQMNCFTIINKHYAMKSDSSESENCDEVEVIPREDLEWYDRSDNDRTLDYTNDPEKRTIWIYSFKNKPNLLAETEYELIDIPSVSGSESSMELGEEAAVYEKVSNVAATARVATPIPTTYVPRLDLTKGSTLPTVTEITEVKSDDDKSPQVFVTKKLKNSWFQNDTTPSRITAHSDHKEREPSEFRWTPLSARERRRKMLYGEDLKVYKRETVCAEEIPEKLTDSMLESKRSVSSQTKPVEIIDVNEDDIKPDGRNRGATPTGTEERISVDVNVAEHEDQESVESIRSPLTTTLQQRDDVFKSENEKPHEQILLQMPAIESNKSDRKAETIAELVPHAQVIPDGETTPIPSGRYKKLHIKVSPNAKPIITEPIENPDSDDWIRETKNEFSNSFDNIHLQVDNAGSRLLARNDLLLRPSRWEGFTAVADSLPSLQITIGDSDSERGDSWWRRLLTCILCR